MANSGTTSEALLTPTFLRRLERLVIAAKRVQLGLSKGERKSKRKGNSSEFADYRDYVQGDDLRHVDWNILSRLDALYLKLFLDQEDLTLHLLVDASQSMDFGTPPKLRFAQSLAAAIGYIGLVGYDRVSVGILSGNGGPQIRPCRGKSSAGKLLEFLAAIEPQGAVDLEQGFKDYFLRRRTKGVVVVISDFLDPGGYEEPLRRLSISGSDVYIIHVLAPEELEPELSGDLKLIDCETNKYTEISVSPALLKRYAKRRDAFCEGMRQDCARRGMGYFLVGSDVPLERLTLDILRQGGMFR